MEHLYSNVWRVGSGETLTVTLGGSVLFTALVSGAQTLVWPRENPRGGWAERRDPWRSGKHLTAGAAVGWEGTECSRAHGSSPGRDGPKSIQARCSSPGRDGPKSSPGMVPNPAEVP